MENQTEISSEFSIRAVEANDIRACFSLRAEMGERYELSPDDPIAQSIFMDYVRGDSKVALVAVSPGGEVVGCLMIEISRMLCKNYAQAVGEGMGVHPDWRRKGIARSLLAGIEDICRERKVLNLVIRTPYAWRSYKTYQNMPGYEERGAFFIKRFT